MKSSFVTVWLLLLVGCGTPSYVVRLDTGEAASRTVRTRGLTRPVELKADEFGMAVRQTARDVRPATNPREEARRLLEMEARTGFFEFNSRTRRLSVANGPETSREERAPGEDELTRDYRRWCEHTGRAGDCLHLMEEGPRLSGDGRYTLAMALAQEVVLDELLEAFKDMADPHAMVSTVLWTCTTYLVLLTVPEPVSKGLAAVMTATLIAYVGVDTFWGLLTGFKQLVLKADRATTFRELHEAGKSYGRTMGRHAARAFAMLATVAVANTAAGFAAKVPKLPGAVQAAVQAEAQTGIRLASVGGVESIVVDGEFITIALAPHAVAMSSRNGQDDGDGTGRMTHHGQQRADEARAGDGHRQVGDSNRVIREGRRFTDAETGNTVHVSGDRVVITNKNGQIVTQFKNPRNNTQSRIQNGKWVPLDD